MILCIPNNLGNVISCFSMTVPLGTQQDPYRTDFVKNGVEELDHPAQSPELYPIQHVFGSIGKPIASQA
uniref:Uncharacterized protein n=1 Tax=Anguilla anguilla TaxID=7936 RepID=A0A0E9W475_ANGAN